MQAPHRPRLNVKCWLFLLAAMLAVTTLAAERIERNARDIVASRYLSEESLADIRERNLLRHGGVATYAFEVTEAGWYELYVEATGWSTELLLDGEPLIYTAFDSGVWEPKGKAKKVLNLHLTAGEHTLTFSRPWHPGLPYMTRFFLEPSTDIAGRVRTTVLVDRLAFRRGEAFPIHLDAGKGEAPVDLHLSLTDVESGAVVWEQTQTVPAGAGNHTATMTVPTDHAGVLDLRIADGQGRAVDRIIQCCVVDTAKPTFADTLTTERLYTIDCVAAEPDYRQGETRTVTKPWGSYRESGDTGRETGTAAADWFAYTLDLPEVQVPYVLEIEYPDDDRRTVPIVLVEQEYGPPEPALGYFSGGTYPLSNSMLTQEFYFFPRMTDPRVLFYNWSTGQRAAVARIHVNRVTSGFPSLKYGRDGREYGMYQEEPLRHLCNFGAMPEGDTWLNIQRPTERAAQLMNYVGTNLWNPTIAVYQSMLWPGDSIPGYQIGILPPGPATLKEPMKKDILRLMLLTCEQYGLNFVGDLHIPANSVLMRTLDERWGGDGNLDSDGYDKPWLIVSNKGEVGLKSPYKPYWNALHPGVQDWAAGVIGELAERYGDSPAFQGVSLRFMGWSFTGWQSFPSIAWGYGDYTIGRFEEETGIAVPVPDDDPERFAKRYEYLIGEQYDAWVAWRTRKMYDYHARLAKVLTDARPELRLYLFLHDADYGHTATPEDYERLGWAGVLRETGLDLDMYARNPGIVPYTGRGFPDGGNRGNGPLENARKRDASAAVEPLAATAGKTAGGTVSTLYFGTNHEGGYVKFAKLGYDKKNILGNKQTIYPDSTVYPAGIHYLERFANALADANVTWLSEGSHGYSIGQPQYLRDWLAEYRAVPDIGMRPVGPGDPVALWQGKDGERTCFYAVNRTWYEPVTATVTFVGPATVTRLATGETIAAPDGKLNLVLGPYELVAFAADAVPQAVRATIPEADQQAFRAMLESAAAIVNTQPEVLSVLPISPVQLAAARTRLAGAREMADAGQFWRARQALQNLDMVRVYEALNTWPSGLMHRQSAPAPQGAMLPGDLAGQLAAADLVDGAAIDPALTASQILAWEGSVDLTHRVPYAGRYRIQFAWPRGEGLVRPVLAVDGKAANGGLPATTGPAWGVQVTPPLSLGAGEHRLTLTAAGKAGLIYLHFEPLYHDLEARHFAVVGPFRGARDVRKSQDVYDSLAADLPVDPVALTAQGRGIDGSELRWVEPAAGQSKTAAFDTGYIDLFDTFGVMSHVVCVAATRINAPEQRQALIKLGSDYWARVTLNGERIFNPENRPRAAPKKGEVTIPVVLQQGENLLTLRNHAGSAGNGFWLAITNPGDLEFANGLE